MRIAILVMITGLFFGMSSCIVLVDERKGHDNGHHWGWYKNPRNPKHTENVHHENNNSNYGHRNDSNHENTGRGNDNKENPGKKHEVSKHRK